MEGRADELRNRDALVVNVPITGCKNLPFHQNLKTPPLFPFSRLYNAISPLLFNLISFWDVLGLWLCTTRVRCTPPGWQPVESWLWWW